MDREFSEADVQAMRRALQLAEEAFAVDDVPIGALIKQHEARVGEGFNQNISINDPTAHAEIQALRQACSYLANYRIPEAEIFVTLEPCPMCFHALIQARIKRIVIGARDPKGGFSQFFDHEDQQRLNHQPIIQFGLLEEESAQLIQRFFKEKRERGKRKWLRNKSQD